MPQVSGSTTTKALLSRSMSPPNWLPGRSESWHANKKVSHRPILVYLYRRTSPPCLHSLHCSVRLTDISPVGSLSYLAQRGDLSSSMPSWMTFLAMLWLAWLYLLLFLRGLMLGAVPFFGLAKIIYMVLNSS